MLEAEGRFTVKPKYWPSGIGFAEGSSHTLQSDRENND
jgi:hypothetical protein